jgi:hypothetical protein
MTDDMNARRNSEATEQVLERVAKERQRQRQKKSYSIKHDNRHRMTDWCAVVSHELGEASHYALHRDAGAFEAAMLKIAATAVASVEAMGRRG